MTDTKQTTGRMGQGNESDFSLLDLIARSRSKEFLEHKRHVEEGPYHPTEELLREYVLDQLDESDAEIIMDHLSLCGPCAREALRLTWVLEDESELDRVTDVVGDDRVERAVAYIREKSSESSSNAKVEIGAYVLKHFFNDDIERTTRPTADKPALYRSLRQHPELSVKPMTLDLMVSVAAQERFFAANNLSSDRLSYSHKAALVKLPNDDLKIRLVQKILGESLPVGKLAKLLKCGRQWIDMALKLCGLYKDDASASSEWLSVDHILEGLPEEEGERRDYLKSLASEERRRLLEQVDETAPVATGRRQAYKAIERYLDEIESWKKPKKA